MILDGMMHLEVVRAYEVGRAPQSGTRVPGSRVQGLDEHQAILRALLAGDPEAAGAAVEAHLVRVKRRSLSHLAGSAAVVQTRRAAALK